MTGLPFTDLNHVLTTTRSVRLRLDYDRPVPLEVIGECLQLALQAPTGGAAEDWRWVVVGDPVLKAELARLYLDAYLEYVHKPLHSAEGAESRIVRGRLGGVDEHGAVSARTARILSGAEHLAHHLGRAPYLVIPCATRPNPATGGPGTHSAVYGSLYPAIWQFNLALRAAGSAPSSPPCTCTTPPRCWASPRTPCRSPCSRSPTPRAPTSRWRPASPSAASPSSTGGATRCPTRTNPSTV
ncbi:nitroreductase family protein [Dactylosporangium cerinum]